MYAEHPGSALPARGKGGAAEAGGRSISSRPAACVPAIKDITLHMQEKNMRSTDRSSKKGLPPQVQTLREQAEEKYRTLEAMPLEDLGAEKIRSLIDELRVHQIELELQKKELRQAQKDQEAARKRFADLYDFAPVGSLTMSREGKILDANLAASVLFGLPRGALLSWSLSHFVSPEFREEYARYLQRLLENDDPQSCELNMLRFDGLAFWGRLESISGRDSGTGEPVCRILLNDITEQKRNRIYRELSNEILKILNESELFHVSIHRIIDSIKQSTACDAVAIRLQSGDDFPYYAQQGFSEDFLRTENTLAVRDRQGHIARSVDGSVKLECICGLVISGKPDPSHPLFTPGGSCWTNDSTPLLSLPSSEDPRISPRNRCIHEGYHSIALIPIRAKQQIIGLLQINHRRKGKFSLDEINALEGIVSHIGGAILRKKAEETLRESKETYQTLFNEMLDSFALHEIISDETGAPVDYRFLAVNPAFEQMMGLKAAEIVGRTVLEVLPGFESRWIDIFGRVAATGQPIHFEIYMASLKKHFDIKAFRPCPGQFACIFADITERKLDAKEKKNLTDQLHQAQKMEAIGTLAGGIAHDFNNILGAILGYAEMIQDDCVLGSRTAQDIREVIRAGMRARDLVKQILAFSRQVETDRIPMQPESVVTEAIQLLRSSLPATISIQLDADPAAGSILADPTHIHQILINLCTNAFHAMEGTGGVLTVSLSRIVVSAADLGKAPHVHPGDFVKLSVKDTGTGMAPETLERMFDPFFTTKETGKGTGMGLAIIHGIVQTYGGFITCQSRLNEGSVFNVHLPALVEETAPPDKAAPAIPVGTEHILFVDDEKVLAEMARNMLVRLGYTVAVHTDSIEALRMFSNQPDSFDLVITDQTMPAMTGVDLARKMLDIRPDIPIILCTGYSNLISEEQAGSMGIKGFAMKPLIKKDFSALIRRTLDAATQRKGKEKEIF